MKDKKRPGAGGQWIFNILLVVVMMPQLGLGMITPAFHNVATDLGITMTGLQWTSSFYMLGYAITMLISGVLAEKYDAGKLQSLGLLVFSVGNALCAVSNSLFMLTSGRFIQALGGCSSTVLSRLIVNDKTEGNAKIRILANLTMVISLTPAIAPLLGGVASTRVSWRLIFVFLSIVSLLLSITCYFCLPRVSTTTDKLPRLQEFCHAAKECWKSHSYRWYAACIGLVWMGYFGFLTVSPSWASDNFGLSGIRYGLLMVVPAICYWFGSLMVKRAASLDRLFKMVGGFSSVWGAAALILSFFDHSENAIFGVVMLSIPFIMVGVAIPYSQHGQLGIDLQYRGISTGIFFFIQMAAGSLYSALLNSLQISGRVSVTLTAVLPLLLLVTATHLNPRVP